MTVSIASDQLENVKAMIRFAVARGNELPREAIKTVTQAETAISSNALDEETASRFISSVQ
jgi:hypothetical protein